MAINNLGGERENAIDASASGRGATTQASLRADTSAIDNLASAFTRLENRIKAVGRAMRETFKGNAIPNLGGTGAAGGSRINVSDASAVNAAFSQSIGQRVGGRVAGMSMLGRGGGMVGGAVGGLVTMGLESLPDIINATSQRVGRGADYSLQADRMSVQLQQMYGMSGTQVRNQLRMPLTQHYMLGGGQAINELLGMQATTGLTAARQAGSVEAFRGMTGYSLSSTDAVRMLTTMASPDVANRMFMMGGTGMYGIGGRERTGMQSIQDIVRRTGLTNPEALKGALQQGSNTRQRLTAMGVPQDMQDMVIQYAMQNTQYQRQTGDKTRMYDPSMEADRRTMGIEETYIVQHEKTTGERVKR